MEEKQSLFGLFKKAVKGITGQPEDTNYSRGTSAPAGNHRFCMNCGAPLPEGSKFCGSCGAPVPGAAHTSAYPAQNLPERNYKPITGKDHFRAILLRNFPQYTVQEDVPVTQLTGDIYDVFKLYDQRPNQAYKAEWGRPYDFVLFMDGAVKAVVMLGAGHTHNKNVKYLVSKMFAKKLGVPYIGFYTQYPNQEDYVVGRIKSMLRQ